LWRGSGGAKRKVDLRARVQGHAKTGIFLFHANTKHAGNAWQNSFAPSCGAAARGGDAFRLQYARIATIAGKDPATKLCLGVSPAILPLPMTLYNTK